MLYGGMGLASIGGIICLVCTIVLIVKMFQRGQTGLGVLCLILFLCTGPIGTLVTLILGWTKATEWNMKNMMLIFTIGFVAFVVGYGMAFAGGFSMINDLQNDPAFRKALEGR